MFIGRKRELEFFNDKYLASGGQLVFLYGRRRIGKTELLREFAKDKPHVFYSCREISDQEQLTAFSQRVLRAGSPAAKYITSFSTWDAALKGVLELPSDGNRRLLIIDEFPYMCKGNPSIPSILQILWDEKFKNSDVMIVLCGSSMSFIEKDILSEKKPLYGRATGIYRLTEMPFWDAVRFFPDYTDEDKLLAYAILGGIPHYLLQFRPDLSLRENIIRNVLTRGSVLYSEVEFLIRQELREPAMYNTIIEAVALGNTQLNDIYHKTQLEKTKISVYLKNLIELQIIEREFSVLSGTKEQAASTRGLYRITDSFFRFWYSFVFPNLSDLESGDAEGIYRFAVEQHLPDFASSAFESICREFLRAKNRNGELPFRVSKLGRWWGKQNRAVSSGDSMRLTAVDTEIDVVAADANSRNFILGECKFTGAVMTVAQLNHLKEKSSFVKRDAAVYYALFSRSGFADSLRETAGDDVTLYSLAEIVNGLDS